VFFYYGNIAYSFQYHKSSCIQKTKSVYGIDLSPVDTFLEPFELNYTNRQIGGVWDLPKVPNWPLGAL